MRATLIRLGLVLFLLALLARSMVSLSEDEQMIVTRFGKPIGKPMIRPGIHYIVPVVDQPHFFPARPIEFAASTERLDAFGHWRITDAVAFYQRLHDGDRARDWITGIVREEMLDVGYRDLQPVDRCSAAAKAPGDNVCGQILVKIQEQLEGFGIEMRNIQLMTRKGKT